MDFLRGPGDGRWWGDALAGGLGVFGDGAAVEPGRSAGTGLGGGRQNACGAVGVRGSCRIGAVAAHETPGGGDALVGDGAAAFFELRGLGAAGQICQLFAEPFQLTLPAVLARVVADSGGNELFPSWLQAVPACPGVASPR